MEYIEGKPVLDYEVCIKHIMGFTGIPKDIVEKVIDAETEYMVKVGIANIEEENK